MTLQLAVQLTQGAWSLSQNSSKREKISFSGQSIMSDGPNLCELGNNWPNACLARAKLIGKGGKKLRGSCKTLGFPLAAI